MSLLELTTITVALAVACAITTACAALLAHSSRRVRAAIVKINRVMPNWLR